ncbi:glycosyltransferase [uncultured Limnobacter sp.]|uniref:glycosyltransferase n=1 Tax=uncultured Limnobacter sp. TaxID=199681 RepID=UPI0030FBF56A
MVTPVFALSGVPLAQTRFARSLARAGHEVDLLIGQVNSGYSLPDISNVNVNVLGCRRVAFMLPPLVSYLKRNDVDVIFSAEDHLNALVTIAALLAGSKAKISGSCRVTPFDTYSNIFFTKRWILKQLSKFVMRRADALTCVSKDMVDQYRQVFKDPPHTCVYNIVDDGDSRERIVEAVDHPWLLDKTGPVLVAAGRLAPWKGFADLINAMSILSVAKFPAKLLILGDGPLRSELQALIERRGVGKTVDLVGYVENPLKYFARSDVFVLSSLVEGLPNVLVEAMMCGCTPVATDCPTGPREVLQHGKFGYLVPVGDSIAIAKAIEQALASPVEKVLLDEAIRPFEEGVVIKRHFEILGLNE